MLELRTSKSNEISFLYLRRVYANVIEYIFKYCRGLKDNNLTLCNAEPRLDRSLLQTIPPSIYSSRTL